MSAEAARVQLLARVFSGCAQQAGGEVLVGIGDDGALLAGPRRGERLVASVDAAVDGVHFDRSLVSLRDVGWRATQAAASDLAAMAARPLAALSALTLPGWVTDDDLQELAEGQREACVELGMAMCGGNLSRGSELSISTTVLGATERAALRSGARPGQLLALAGAVGRAAAGLAWLRGEARPQTPGTQACARAWRRPEARIDVRERLARATAAIDVSDGLARDAGALARASGVRVVLDELGVLAAGGEPLREAAEELQTSPLGLALTGGEDYAILAAFWPGDVPGGFVVVGETVGGEGLALRGREGERALEETGFDHFSP